jgi:hypothetical protein
LNPAADSANSESSSDWKILLPTIPLSFDDEKISEEELREAEKPKTKKRKVKKLGSELSGSAVDQESTDQLESTSPSAELLSPSREDSIEPSRSGNLGEIQEKEEEKEAGSEEKEEGQEEEEEFEEEEEEGRAKKKVTPEEKKQLVILDSIHLSYLRHMGTLFEALEFDRFG